MPPHSSFFYLKGTLGPYYGNCSVTIDPPVITTSRFPYQWAYLASRWIVPNATLFVSPLDPTINYTVTVERSPTDTGDAVDPRLNQCGLTSITFMHRYVPEF